MSEAEQIVQFQLKLKKKISLNLRTNKNLQGVLTHKLEDYNRCVALVDMHSLKSVLNSDVNAWRQKLDREYFDSAKDAR